MLEMIADFKKFVNRYKVVLAILALMSGPSLITLGTSVWYYSKAIENLRDDYDVRLLRSQGEVDFERVYNRGILHRMQDNIQHLQDYLRQIAQQVGVSAEKLERVTDRVEGVATEVKQAATKADKAVKSATEAVESTTGSKP